MPNPNRNGEVHVRSTGLNVCARLAVGIAFAASTLCAPFAQAAATSTEAAGTFDIAVTTLQGRTVGDSLDLGHKAIPRKKSQFNQVLDGIEVIVTNTRYDHFIVTIDSTGTYQGPRDKVKDKIVGCVNAPLGKGAVENLSNVDLSRGKHVLYRSGLKEQEVRLVYSEGVTLEPLQCGGTYSRRIVFSIEPV